MSVLSWKVVGPGEVVIFCEFTPRNGSYLCAQRRTAHALSRCQGAVSVAYPQPYQHASTAPYNKVHTTAYDGHVTNDTQLMPRRR